jgi:uncharacterized protein YjbI with pentapeptide repeats
VDEVAAELRADCSRCTGLCCVVPAFAASADFAISKAAHTPCPNLRTDHRCGIHASLRERGFPGCTVYDCFGAGQLVAQGTFGGRDWRRHPELRGATFAVFPVVRDLQELRYYLTEALDLPTSAPIRAELAAALDRVVAATALPPADLRSVDVAGLRGAANPLLQRASALARPAGPDHRGADLAGARLRGADLRGASLRGALLLGADLTGADLRGADFTGADLRGADLTGADLTGALFLTRAQLTAARGAATTRLPQHLTHPTNWG